MEFAIGIAITIVIFVVGIPLAYFVGRRNRQTPDLRSARDFDEVLSPGDWLLGGQLDIAFDGRPLSRVSRTYIALWNHRGDTVRGTEILDIDPLRVVVNDDDEILQIRVVSQSRVQIGVGVTSLADEAPVTFEFLDPKDGFVLEVMHRGESPAALFGTIPGAKIGDARKVDLGRKARQLLRFSWPRRLKALSSRRAIPAAIFAGIVSLAFSIALIVVQLQAMTPHLIAIKKYDLHTLDGQHHFAQEVQQAGDPFSFVMAGLLLVFAFFYAFLAWRATRAFVPRQIALNDVDPEPAVENDNAGGLRRQAKRATRSSS